MLILNKISILNSNQICSRLNQRDNLCRFFDSDVQIDSKHYGFDLRSSIHFLMQFSYHRRSVLPCLFAVRQILSIYFCLFDVNIIQSNVYTRYNVYVNNVHGLYYIASTSLSGNIVWTFVSSEKVFKCNYNITSTSKSQFFDQFFVKRRFSV